MRLFFPSQRRQEKASVNHMGMMGREITASMLRTGLIKPWSVLADVIYPPACAGCGVSTGAHRSRLPCLLVRHPVHRAALLRGARAVRFPMISGRGSCRAEAIANPPVFDRLRSVCHSRRHCPRSLVHGLKYRDRTDLAPMMAEMDAARQRRRVAACDAIIPVPLHRAAAVRAQVQSVGGTCPVIWHGISGKPLLAATLIAHEADEPAGRSRGEGARGQCAWCIRLAGGSRQAMLFGSRIVLVDDVYTTGATVSAATRVLKKAGAADVTVLTFARAVGRSYMTVNLSGAGPAKERSIMASVVIYTRQFCGYCVRGEETSGNQGRRICRGA